MSRRPAAPGAWPVACGFWRLQETEALQHLDTSAAARRCSTFVARRARGDLDGDGLLGREMGAHDHRRERRTEVVDVGHHDHAPAPPRGKAAKAGAGQQRVEQVAVTRGVERGVAIGLPKDVTLGGESYRHVLCDELELLDAEVVATSEVLARRCLGGE